MLLTEAAPERIVAAAVRFKDGSVYIGHSHYDAYWEKAHTDTGEEEPDVDSIYATGDEGFMTSSGRIVSREEALDIAKAASQYSGNDEYPWLDYLEVDRDQYYYTPSAKVLLARLRSKLQT